MQALNIKALLPIFVTVLYIKKSKSFEALKELNMS